MVASMQRLCADPFESGCSVRMGSDGFSGWIVGAHARIALFLLLFIF